MKEDWRAVAEANGIKINLHKNHDVRSKIFFTKNITVTSNLMTIFTF